MNLAKFITNLYESGHLTLDFEIEDNQEGAREAIRQVDQQQRLHWPYQAPELNEDICLWAFETLQLFVYAYVDSNFNSDEIKQNIRKLERNDFNTEDHYSVDLAFSYLIDLYELIKIRNASDPLAEIIHSQAKAWPLSLVGIEDVEIELDDKVFHHPALQAVLCDRIYEYRRFRWAKIPLLQQRMSEISGQRKDLQLI